MTTQKHAIAERLLKAGHITFEEMLVIIDRTQQPVQPKRYGPSGLRILSELHAYDEIANKFRGMRVETHNPVQPRFKQID